MLLGGHMNSPVNIAKMFKNNFFHRAPLVAASEDPVNTSCQIANTLFDGYLIHPSSTRKNYFLLKNYCSN